MYQPGFAVYIALGNPMRLLVIPQALKSEFATVEALWGCAGTTRRVDALLLCWVKYEKQLRRLFSFLVFQHPHVTEKTIESVVSVMVKNRNLYPETFEKCIKALGVPDVPTLIGAHHSSIAAEMRRIKRYRNKLMHGQITGENVSSNQIEKDVLVLINWISSLAAGAQNTFGYDGIQRNTFRAAKAASGIAVSSFPFANSAEFKTWLEGVCNA
jgi:hypothetical protein